MPFKGASGKKEEKMEFLSLTIRKCLNASPVRKCKAPLRKNITT